MFSQYYLGCKDISLHSIFCVAVNLWSVIYGIFWNVNYNTYEEK